MTRTHECLIRGYDQNSLHFAERNRHQPQRIVSAEQARV